MNEGDTTRLTAEAAADVCRRFPAGEAATGLLDDTVTPQDFLDRLIGAGEFADAVRFLAHALPKREGVWWAALAARAGAELSGPEEAAVQAAEAWASDPTEGHRRAAMPAAEAATFATPAGCAAVAAFWSGGSLSPPDTPVIPPGENLTAMGVAGAVLTAVAVGPPERLDATYRALLARGLAVARGEDLWPAPAAPPQAPGPAPSGKAAPAVLKQAINWE